MVDTPQPITHTDTPTSDPPHRLTPRCTCLNTPLIFQTTSAESLSFLQLNCHLSKAITLTLLNHPHLASIILLQEPWVNPHTLLPPAHADWHMFAGYEHQPSNWRDRHKSCIYVCKSIPTENLIQLPTNSKHLLGLQLRTSADCAMVLVNVYNPPRTNEGLKDLSRWLESHNNQQSPISLFMDSNLHHRLWNPVGHYSSHCEATEPVRLCGSAGFQLTSPKHVPTFYSAKGKGTTIDLIWTNFKASKMLTDI